jgi:hypothetical protein
MSETQETQEAQQPAVKTGADDAIRNFRRQEL